ncbi:MULTISPECIES: DUF3742 family protein [Pseudomonas]|uniref:cold-shock protein n=1 Tax=Pseudomonas TaxID=286 RepID=UPI001FF28B7F
MDEAADGLPVTYDYGEIYVADMDSRAAGSIAGVVISFVPIKGYGFIKGEDREQYFFHLDDVEGRAPLVTGQNVTFMPTPSAKGSKAKRVVPGPGPTDIYVEPYDFVWSKAGPPKGMKRVLITGKGWSESSDLNKARQLLIETARLWGANAVLHVTQSRYTEEEGGSNYKYTVHRFDAELAVVKVIKTTSDPELIAASQAQMQTLKDWWARCKAQHSSEGDGPSAARRGSSYRLGFCLGRFSGRYQRAEDDCMDWLLDKGVPTVLADVLKMSVRLIFLGCFLYLALWIVPLILGLLVLMGILREDPNCGAERVDSEVEEPCPDPPSIYSTTQR